MTANCSACSAPITWGRTKKNNRPVPLELQMIGGYQVLGKIPRGTPYQQGYDDTGEVIRVLTKAEDYTAFAGILGDWVNFRETHYARCPEAARFHEMNKDIT